MWKVHPSYAPLIMPSKFYRKNFPTFLNNRLKMLIFAP